MCRGHVSSGAAAARHADAGRRAAVHQSAQRGARRRHLGDAKRPAGAGRQGHVPVLARARRRAARQRKSTVWLGEDLKDTVYCNDV